MIDWIHVDDESPIIRKDVLVCYNYDLDDDRQPVEISLGTLFGPEEWLIYYRSYPKNKVIVTHWAELNRP
jgi:hypothetical protein